MSKRMTLSEAVAHAMAGPVTKPQHELVHCRDCKYANGGDRYNTPTFEKEGYAVCTRVKFNDREFWIAKKDGGPDEPPAWVVDGSDYWAALYVTPDFGCVLGERKEA